jgi:Bifunctional DNA primase/polymerase, N-terminal
VSAIKSLNSSMSLNAALTLAERGLPCFPCRADKRPATPNGFKDATRESDKLQVLWKRHPGPLVGVATGEISGLDILDIDPRHGGKRWFAEHHHRVTPTRMHKTASGGVHLVFEHLPGLRCSAGKIAAGVDVRATGGYVIWWPAAGFQAQTHVPITRWPDWLSRQLLSSSERKVLRTTVPDSSALTRLVELVARARPGERNNLTYWAACRAGEMVASGLLAIDVVAAVIAEAATRAGLPRAEAERTVWSGIRATAGPFYA